MKIGSIMTRNVVTVALDDTLRTIHEIFDSVKFHHLLVMEGDVLCGVISDRDVLKAISPFLNTPSELPRDTATLNKHAHQIMIRRLVTVAKEESVENALRLLLRENVSCLPVVSKDGRIEGIVTWKDMMKSYLQSRN